MSGDLDIAGTPHKERPRTCDTALHSIHRDIRRTGEIGRMASSRFHFAKDASGERLGFSRVKEQLDKEIMLMLRREESAATAPRFVLPWRFHDLRRALATGLQRQGTRFEAIEAILNHRLGDRSGVAGVYQRHSWHEEMRETLNVWGMHLDSIVEKFAPDPE